MSKPRKLCIFCGGHSITKEHMWPDWLRNYIPRTKTQFHSQKAIVFRASTQAKTTTHTGDPHSSRVRRVCQSCNNGWMSELQTRAKPILVPLINGERCTLRRQNQLVLASWITMFTMVAEFRLRSDEYVAISESERNQFKDTRRPLMNWKIWIGCIDDQDWIGRYVHTSMPVVSKDDPVKQTSDGVPVPNTQTTTFTVNKLYVHVLSSTVIDLDVQRISTRLAQRIWPPYEHTMRWPPRRLLSRDSAHHISKALLDGVIQRSRARATP